jgi:hypothetical protein
LAVPDVLKTLTSQLPNCLPILIRNERTQGATDETRNKHGFYEQFYGSVFYPCFIRG